MSNGIERVPHLKGWATIDVVETITTSTTTGTFGAPPPGYVWDVLSVALAVPDDAGPWTAHLYIGSASAPEHAVGVGRSAAADLALTFDSARETVCQSGEPLSWRITGYAGTTGTVRARARVRLLEIEDKPWPAQPTAVVMVGDQRNVDWPVEIPTEAVDG